MFIYSQKFLWTTELCNVYVRWGIVDRHKISCKFEYINWVKAKACCACAVNENTFRVNIVGSWKFHQYSTLQNYCLRHNDVVQDGLYSMLYTWFGWTWKFYRNFKLILPKEIVYNTNFTNWYRQAIMEKDNKNNQAWR